MSIATLLPVILTGGLPIPRRIPNLKVWLDATQLTGLIADNGAITTWSDKSGNGLDVAQSTANAKPILKLNAFNYHAAIYFDGGDNLTNATKANWRFLHNGTNYTSFVVFMTPSSNPDSASGFWGDGGNASANIGVQFFYDDRSSVTREDKLCHLITKGASGDPVLNHVSADDIVTPRKISIASVVLETGTGNPDSTIKVDNGTASTQDLASGPYNSEDATYNFFVGQVGNDQLIATIYIAEIIIYSRALSAGEYTQIYNYLLTKYGNATVGVAGDITNDTSYNSVPGVVNDGGTLRLVYRKGTSHASDKGSVKIKTSTDGITWSTEANIYTDATYDSAPGGITKLANGSLIVPFRLYDHGNTTELVDACYVTISTDNGATWGTAIRLNDSYTLGSNCSAPVLQLANGTLLYPFFGKNTGDTYDSASIQQSTDNGATWGGEVLIADGETASANYQEPNLVQLASGRILCFLRDSVAKVINMCYSDDNGATWSAPAQVFTGWGAPHVTKLSTGKLVVTSRDAVTNKAIFYTSIDNGATWSSATVIDAGVYVQMVYASAVEFNSKVGITYAVEIAADNSDIKWNEYLCSL